VLGLHGGERNRTIRYRSVVDRSEPRGAARPHRATTDAIREACVAELTERGYHALSMDSVARRSGVGKAALYRRWSGKQAMVVAVVQEITSTLRPTPTFRARDLEGDLLDYAFSAQTWLADPRILADLIAAGLREPSLMTALRGAVESVLLPTQRLLSSRAQERGDPDPREAASSITALIFWRQAVLGEVLSERDIHSLTLQAIFGMRNGTGADSGA
jgi:AcrR family transcriptional regulator